MFDFSDNWERQEALAVEHDYYPEDYPEDYFTLDPEDFQGDEDIANLSEHDDRVYTDLWEDYVPDFADCD